MISNPGTAPGTTESTVDLSEAQFNHKAMAAMERIEQAIDASGADIDYETVSEILTLEFADGSKIIVNKQGAVKQLWVAAKSGGFHYRYDATRDVWLNDQSGVELFKELSSLVSRQHGAPVNFA